MLYCPMCGREVAEDKKACPDCGYSLIVEPVSRGTVETKPLWKEQYLSIANSSLDKFFRNYGHGSGLPFHCKIKRINWKRLSLAFGLIFCTFCIIEIGFYSFWISTILKTLFTTFGIAWSFPYGDILTQFLIFCFSIPLPILFMVLAFIFFKDSKKLHEFHYVSPLFKGENNAIVRCGTCNGQGRYSVETGEVTEWFEDRGGTNSDASWGEGPMGRRDLSGWRTHKTYGSCLCHDCNGRGYKYSFIDDSLVDVVNRKVPTLNEYLKEKNEMIRSWNES